jgi:orc1/cdc6 family replication initiation protein
MTIDMFFQKSDVFQDLNVFNEGHIPDVFLYRDEEIKTVGTSFARLYKGSGFSHMWINGPPSTGKTQVVKRLIREFNAHAEAEHKKVFYAYTNARGKTLPPVYGELLSQLDSNSTIRGIHPMEIVYKIKKLVKSRYRYVNFIFDEIDKIIPTPSHKNPIDEIIGTFTRLHEDSGFDMSDIGYMITVISNDMYLHKHLSPSTLSTFVAHNVKFNEYDAEQLGAIFIDRCEKGFIPGVIKEEDVLHFSANLCKGVKDVRTGLQVLLASGNIAEKRTDGAKSITWDDIQKAFKIVEKNKLYETIMKLDEPQLAFLVAVAKVQQRREMATTNLVYRIYTQIAGQHCFEILKPRYMMEFIAPKLDSTGLITTAVKGRGRGKGITRAFEVLEEELKDILAMGEKELEKRSA